MYAKPEINKWCCNTSQTFLPCLHCVSILPRGVCSVGGLHFHQHTVISVLSSFPLFIMGVPSCIKSFVSKNGVQTKENTDMRTERTATQWRANMSGQALPDPHFVHGNSIFCKQAATPNSLPALPSHCFTRKCCKQGEGLCHHSVNAERELLCALDGGICPTAPGPGREMCWRQQRGAHGVWFYAQSKPVGLVTIPTICSAVNEIKSRQRAHTGAVLIPHSCHCFVFSSHITKASDTGSPITLSSVHYKENEFILITPVNTKPTKAHI